MTAHEAALDKRIERADGPAPVPYLGVWCPTCWLDSLPLRTGICPWCDTKIAEPELG